MAKCDATVFNLSMLTSDAWGALWSVILFHHGLSWAYFVSLAVTVCGVVLYNTAGFATPPADTLRAKHQRIPTTADDDTEETPTRVGL
jgi:drug/metabolite transporter (DMT)-like permease